MTVPSDAAVESALAALRRMRARLEAAERAATEPIAIVGSACRFPGGADVEAFWRSLAEGRDAVGDVPDDRWRAEDYYDPDPQAKGKMVCRRGGFLADVAGFDAAFFGISPREAAAMDPQQRLLLEVAHEAIERAGLPLDRLAGRPVGVYVGVMANDYAALHFADLTRVDGHSYAGHSFIANRLSYLLDLRGPSLAVDTACSSSLVAIHLACQSLRSRECDVALAGGVNLILTPYLSVTFSQWGMLSPDGRCKTFDARADGFVRGEGCGAIVLKRISDARAENDPILAVIRGSAVNQDGRTNVFTAPSGLAQEGVIRSALANAGIKPEQVGYVEAHGTGTPLGDPIEIDALARVYGHPRQDGRPCFVGAVKTNIGHLESAAGMAGIIKALGCLQHGAVPPNLHCRDVNPHIRIEGSALRLPAELSPWPAGTDGARFAAVSSFGAGGTNAHVVLESAPTHGAPARRTGDGRRTRLMPVSARSPEALRARAAAYREMVEREPASLDDICYTACVRRTHHPVRGIALGASRAEMVEQLATLAAGRPQRVPDDPVAAAYLSGEAIPWERLFPEAGTCVPLPGYPWQRERYWIETPRRGQAQAQPPRQAPEAASAAAGADADGRARGPVAASPEPSPAGDHGDGAAGRAELVVTRWRRAAQAPPPARAADGAWLVLTDRSGFGARLLRLLEERGLAYVRVQAGDAYRRRDDGSFTLPEADPEGARRLLREAFGPGRPRCRGVVHLPGVDAAAAEPAALARSCAAALHVLQALVAERLPGGPRLWLATRGVHDLSATRNLSPWGSVLWGLGRTARLEAADVWGGLVDLDDLDDLDAQRLLEELEGGGEEDEVAVRAGVRWVPRLTGREHAPAVPLRCRPDGTYLITGGLGALGLQVAELLAGRGARRLVLTGRRAPSSHALAVVGRCQAAGARVDVVASDAGARDQLERVVAGIRRDGPPLRGVVHAAGIREDAVLARQDGRGFARAMEAKVAGAWNLHLLTQDSPLDFFVLFSSVAALLGSAGQANYAAANAFLDALAAFRNAGGLPALSIDWGAWAGDGMAARLDAPLRHRLAERGILPMAPADAIRALEALLSGADACAAALAVDWQAYVGHLPGRRTPPRLSNLLPAARRTERAGTRRLEVLAPAERRRAVEDRVREAAAQVLGLRAPAQVPPRESLFALGLDSLLAFDLVERLERDFGLSSLPVSLPFDHPTVEELAGQLTATLFPDPGAGGAEPLADRPQREGSR